MGNALAIPSDDASGAVTENNLLSSADLSDDYKAIADPEESVSLCEPFLHSKDNQPIYSKDQRNDQKEKNGNNKDELSPMEFDESNKPDEKQKVNPGKEVEVIITTP